MMGNKRINIDEKEKREEDKSTQIERKKIRTYLMKNEERGNKYRK